MKGIDVEARAAKRLGAESARRAVRWPFECPTCFSPNPPKDGLGDSP